MPWVEIAMVPDQKSTNWIALETRFKAANGKRWMRNWKLEEIGMCHCLFRSLMTSAIEQKNILISKLFWIILKFWTINESLNYVLNVLANYVVSSFCTFRLPSHKLTFGIPIFSIWRSLNCVLSSATQVRAIHKKWESQVPSIRLSCKSSTGPVSSVRCSFTAMKTLSIFGALILATVVNESLQCSSSSFENEATTTPIPTPKRSEFCM